MQHIQKIKILFFTGLATVALVLAAGGLVAQPQSVSADNTSTGGAGGYFGCPDDPSKIEPDNPYCKQNCEGLSMSWDEQSQKCIEETFDPATSQNKCATLDRCDLVNKYINPLIQLLSALVGVAVVASIIIGGIQYSSSAGDPQKASAAKARIRNAIVALVAFIFLYALLDFLMPGGLFNTK
jgi:hypothetical protein